MYTKILDNPFRMFDMNLLSQYSRDIIFIYCLRPMASEDQIKNGGFLAEKKKNMVIPLITNNKLVPII